MEPTGSAMAMDVASRAQARLTIPREQIAARRRHPGLNTSTLGSSTDCDSGEDILGEIETQEWEYRNK